MNSVSLCRESSLSVEPLDAPSVEADSIRGDVVYNEFYRTGGWKYRFWPEYWWHRRHIVKRFHLRKGMRVLEVGCGAGFHTNLLRKMGLDCIGIDRSESGISWAREHFPRSTYVCCDIFDEIPLENVKFDAVYARGCSHYHYDLMGNKALRTTKRLMEFLKPGGVFIMAIVTDQSGRREPNQIWQNTLDDYRRHFSSFGIPWSVDWMEGTAVCSVQQILHSAGPDPNINVVTERT